MVIKNTSLNYANIDFEIFTTPKGNKAGVLPVAFKQDSHIYNTLDVGDTLVASNCGFKNKILDIEGNYMNNKLKLWDFLDQQNGYEVDEKYYLSDQQLINISNWNSYEKPLENIVDVNSEKVGTLTTRSFDMTSSIKLVNVNARIRKLTPREAYRLMGLNDNQIDKLTCGNVISDANHYKLAGNSIVIPVLEHIFKEKMDLPKDRPIKLVEFFAGYGSQHQALKNLGYQVNATISEWFTEAIIAYALLHHFKEYTKLLDKHKGLSKQDLQTKIAKITSSATFSSDSKTPSKTNLKTYKKKLEFLCALVAVKNLGSIVEVKGHHIKDTQDIFTWSFPCQDLSQAGKGAGMSSTETRSGLCWEFIRILKELKELKRLPKYLLMENVPAIHNKRNIEDFNRLQKELNEIGYDNEWFDLNAVDFGVPQNRNRTFMVSKLKGV